MLPVNSPHDLSSPEPMEMMECLARNVSSYASDACSYGQPYAEQPSSVTDSTATATTVLTDRRSPGAHPLQTSDQMNAHLSERNEGTIGVTSTLGSRVMKDLDTLSLEVCSTETEAELAVPSTSAVEVISTRSSIGSVSFSIPSTLCKPRAKEMREATSSPSRSRCSIS